MRKFELTKETRTIRFNSSVGNAISVKEKPVYRIKALRDFSDVKEGDLGGYVESESNLSHFKNCWVYENSCVHGNAIVQDNAVIKGESEISGTVVVTENASVEGKIELCGQITLGKEARIYGTVALLGKEPMRLENVTISTVTHRMDVDSICRVK